ncbi:inverse autotransporter beta domain-containing protein [Thorsellia anophelis]|uniref:Invasin beta-domain of outer membrane n=1 Tax=Thorsellia anophelis DSM 18579 TaxID=1123402 RepID=A0A1H9Y805_9GAMM|nr:inverse autotransporter beta domain-containing protein [Thorsellia anophelis]SES64908.1 Invasin beta-domain of outer membrane [Thorsellia anophelis DSM 18579]
MKNKKIKSSLMLAMIIVFSSYANAEELKNRDNHFSTENDFILYEIERPTSILEIVLEHNMTLSEFNELNDNEFIHISQLETGQIIKLPVSQNTHRNIQESTNNVVGLPSLNSQLDDSTIDVVLNQTPMAQYMAGDSDENLARFAQSAATEDWSNLSSKALQQKTEDYIINQVQSEVNRQVNKQASDFLGKFGKAEVNVSIDKDGKLQSGSLRVLTPLYDENENLWFSQVGVHEQGSGNDKRVVGNFGLGYRYETSDWLLGSNAFIDHDFSGSNTRLGIGGEFWMDYLKLSTNFYTPLSDWKESEVLKNYESLIYDERPARGFDIRAQSYLPSYPHLGGSLVFEKYFGDEVALFSTQDRQKDPHALTFGLDYTPIPLVTADLSHKIGKNGMDDTRFGMTVNLQLGTPIEQQLDPRNVALARSLKGSRYDIVDRNYDIVFEYRQEDFEVIIDGPSSAKLNQTVQFTSSVQSRAEVSEFQWIVVTPIGTKKEPRANEGNTGRTFVFSPNLPGTYSIALQVKTERGYVATSNAIELNVGIESSSYLVWKDDIDRAEIVSDISISEEEILGLAFDKKLQLDFITKDSNGPVDIPDPKLLWRKQGTSDDFRELNRADGIYYALSKFRDATQYEYWRFHIIADERFEDEKIEFIAKSDRHNLEIISSNVVSAQFVKSEPSILNPEELIFEIYQVQGPGSSYEGPPLLVSRSGIKDSRAFNYQSPEPVYTNSYYEVVLRHPDSTTGELTDVTGMVEHSIEWAYVDPESGLEIRDSENAVLSRCNGYPVYATQITNYENNDLAFGALLSEGKDELYKNEQQLALIAKINYKQIQDPSNAKQGRDRICFGQKDGFFYAEDGYIGFRGNTREERVAAVENRRAGEWK